MQGAAFLTILFKAVDSFSSCFHIGVLYINDSQTAEVYFNSFTPYPTFSNDTHRGQDPSDLASQMEVSPYIHI